MNARVDLNEPERHQVSRYLAGLRDSIREQLALHSVWQLSEAVNLAYRVESTHSKNLRRHSPNPRSSGEVKTGQGQLPSVQRGKSFDVIRSPHYNTIGSSLASMEQTPPSNNRGNSYARPTTIKCYRCSQPGHKSNECPRRKALVVEDEEVTQDYTKSDKFDEEQYETEEVEGDAGEPLICIVEPVLFARHPERKQRHAIFRTRCTI